MSKIATVPEPHAYTEGFLQQDYDVVMLSLLNNPDQAKLVFGSLHTSLLHAAAYDGKADIAEQLIRLGADVNCREVNGKTPLHDAANNGHLDVIELLLMNGANIEAKDNGDMTPLMWGRISRSGRIEQVVNLLIKHGAKN